ncbi:MAG: alpha/beta hydrolase, partial [Lentisphaeria bacterium]|nr:alpha/beta hydrolase [Lentisphaeria bacterium]
LNLIYSGFVVRMILKYAYAPHHTPDSGLCANYAADLNRPGRIEALIAAARTYAHPSILPADGGKPMVIIAGDEDRILSYEAAERLHRYYPESSLSFLSGCGHIPQEECPAETAAILKAFIFDEKEPAPIIAQPETHRKMRLSRLFDFWRPGTLVLMVILKILTFFRWLGVRVEQQSWRKISRFFLKREYSKFAIGQFRLQNGEHPSRIEAEKFLEQRLHDFLIGQPDLHGLPGQRIFLRRQQEKFCDLMTAEIDEAGRILSVTPHFDPRFAQPKLLIGKILETIVEVHNECRHLSDLKRQEKIRKECRKRLCRPVRFHPRRRLLILSWFERIMSGTFLFYGRLLPKEETALDAVRFTPPDLRAFRHPGWGQTNIVCRLTADFREADLWWQFNHTMVDGAPMQEILSLLKKQWGCAGPLIFPSLGGLVSQPELMDCGDSLFRAHFFADFTPLLRLRSSLNRMCTPQMNGKASFAALLMWGLARHPYFRGRKMLLPVDCRCPDHSKRQLGLLITRPDRYDQGTSPLNDFCQFQTFVNLHLNEIRRGQAETSEMLSLFGMLHPFFYLLTQKLYPHALEEMLGTVGISIIAEAEIFISPQTDIQINGFMSLGSVLIQTRDGRQAGSVCVSGTKEQIELYHEALTQLIRDLPHLLER